MPVSAHIFKKHERVWTMKLEREPHILYKENNPIISLSLAADRHYQTNKGIAIS